MSFGRREVTAVLTIVDQDAGLAVTMTDGPDPVVVDNNLTYTITVINNDPTVATGVTLTDTLPDGVTFVSASVGCDKSGGTVTCDLGDLASGARAMVAIRVSPTAEGIIGNAASVTSANPDPVTGSKTVTENTMVILAAPTPTPTSTPRPVPTPTASGPATKSWIPFRPLLP